MAYEDRSIFEEVSEDSGIEPELVKQRLLVSADEEVGCGFEKLEPRKTQSGLGPLDCLPDEILLEIFRRVGHKELCRLSRACRRFRDVADDVGVWKRLYRQRYEYDLPLFNPRPGVFEFQQPKESGLANPWKESFRQLYKGIHVYPPEDQPGNRVPSGYEVTAVPRFSSVSQAVRHAQQRDGIPIVFVHPGEYRERCGSGGVNITSDLAVIGAGSGNFAERVVIELSNAINFEGPARNSYLGYLSVRFRECVLQEIKYIIRMRGDLVTPTIENCFIRGTECSDVVITDNLGVLVMDGTDPIIRRSHISCCKQGILVLAAKGSYEDNVISDNSCGICWNQSSNSIVRRNKIWNQAGCGIVAYGTGTVEHNDIHNNACNIEFVVSDTGPLIIRGNRISHGRVAGIRTLSGTHCLIEDNTFTQNRKDLLFEQTVVDPSRVVVRRNVFTGSKNGVVIDPISIVETGDNKFLNREQ